MIWSSIFGSILLVSWTSGMPTADEKPQVCNKKGRISNPKDCGSYFECMEDDYAKSLLSYKRFCPTGHSFNSSSERCGKTLNAQGCSASGGRHLSSNPKYDYICKDSKVSFACTDCQTQITCIGGHAYVTKCVNKMRCVDNSPDFKGGVCHSHFDDQCRCLKPNSYRRDPYTNSKYFLCDKENAVPTYHNCPQGMYFDEITKACVNNDGTPACTASGLFTFPENCAKYYNCTSADEGWDQKIISCPKKELFNQEAGMCEDPCNWELKGFQCETQGRFQNPMDCQRFIECVIDDNGDLLAMERICPPGFHFNEKNTECVVRASSSCMPFKEGPLKQCQKEFLAICKSETKIISETISEINKTPKQSLDKGKPTKIISKTISENKKTPEQSLAKGKPTKTIPGTISETKKTPEQSLAKGKPTKNIPETISETKKTPEQSLAKGKPTKTIPETISETKKTPEQSIAKGTPTNGTLIGEASAKEMPIKEKPKTEKKTEGKSVEETLVEE